jgi:hypothetical protein
MAAGVLAGMVTLQGVPRAQAGSGVFAASATASGGRLSFVSPGAPATDTPLDGGGPIAEARLDNLRAGGAFASLPYPGDLFVANASSLPGIVPGAPPPPPYPFYASANGERPEQSADYGLVKLHAEAAAVRSAAEGIVVTTGAVLREASEARVEAPVDGNIVARATQHLDGVALGNLRIAEVAATAEVSLSPAGVRTRHASFTMNGITVAGRPIGFRDGRLVTAEGPAKGARPETAEPGHDDPLQPVLDQAGLNVTIVPNRETDTGVVAGGVEIRTGGKLPNGSSGIFTLVVGQVTASVAGEPGPDVGPIIEPTPATDSMTGPEPGSVAIPGSDRALLDRGATTSASRPTTTPFEPAAGVSGGSSPPVQPEVRLPTSPAPAPGVSVGAPTALLDAGGRAPIDGVDSGLYAALALGGVGVAGLAQFVRVGKGRS